MRISDWSSDVCSSDLEPGDGYWSNVWNAQPFSTSYWGGRPTQDQMYTTAYYSEADWNDTRFFRPDFDKLLLSARAELDQAKRATMRSEEHTSELQSLMRISYAVFCLKKKKPSNQSTISLNHLSTSTQHTRLPATPTQSIEHTSYLT